MLGDRQAISKVFLLGLALSALAPFGAGGEAFPEAPNPYLSFLPAEARPDWESWRARMAEAARERRRTLARGGPGTLIFAENELPGGVGDNDHPLIGEPLTGFGAGAGQTPRAELRGRLVPRPTLVTVAEQEDGAISMAHPVSVPQGGALAVRQRIGDGDFGGAGNSGDFDFYSLTAAAGWRIEVSVRTPDPFGPLNPIAALYDASGVLLAFNDVIPLPGFISTFDSYFSFVTPAAGTYYVAVGGHSDAGEKLDMLPDDPFDPASGPGAGSEGAYEVTIAIDFAPPADVDVFHLELEAGDVVGATLLGSATRLALVDASNEVRISADGADLSAIYPAGSPLPGGGRAAIAYVIDTAGTYGIAIDRAVPASGGGDGTYRAELAVFRPPLALEERPASQILFLDFDGAVIDRGLFGVSPQEVALSPLKDFLPGWGLMADDEPALIEAVLRTASEDLSEDLRARGKNGDFQTSGLVGEFDIEIRNSRDHPDPFGEPRVSRVVVGGTVEELQLLTIGIAESVDVGNFASEETAVVLLDLLSAAESNPNSLNSIERDPETSMIELVGTVLGRIVAHEAGHLFANFHTARDVGPTTIMDRGGDLPRLAGVGDDEIFGTADDLDVDFGPDLYEGLEAFTGEEETLEAISFGLATGGGRPSIRVSPRSHDYGALAPGSGAEKDFLLTNDGNRDLRLLAPPTIEGDTADFSLTSGSSALTLTPGARHTLTARFAPGALGSRTATLSLQSDDPARGRLEVPLRGQGGVPAVSIDALMHDYGDLFYGDASTSLGRTFFLTNGGPGDLFFDQLFFVGPDPRAFRVDRDGGLRIPPGEARELPVLFQPGGAVGALEATLVLLGNDPATPRLDLRLRGFAWGPDIDIDPTSPFFFGQIRVGVRRVRTFFLENLGNRDLTVTATLLTGDEAADFSLDSGTGARVLAPGETHELVVAFTPPSAEISRTVLRIENDDPDERPLEILLAGLGVEPDLAVEPPAFDFGPVPLAEGLAQPFQLTNEGGFRLFISKIELLPQSPDDAFAILGQTSPFFLLPGNTTTVWVEFLPGAVGERHAVLEIESDDPDEPLTRVVLRGEGLLLRVTDVPALSPLGLWLMMALFALAAWSSFRRRRSGRASR